MRSSTVKREESVEQLARLKLERLDLQELIASTKIKDELEELQAGYDAISYRYYQAIDLYLESLEIVNLSRCPLSGRLVSIPMDLAGFGGPWWDYEHPVRELWSGPSSFCGFTGGANLLKLSEKIDHFCKPGISQPFVLPKVLRLPGVRAVLSSFLVADTPIYVLSHFAEQRPVEMPCISDLASSYATLIINGRPVKREGIPVETLEIDFELERWIRIGKLYWIAERDESCLLRSDLKLCPYLKIANDKSIVRVSRGVLSRTPVSSQTIGVGL